MCDFITEYQGHRDPALKIGMHISSARSMATSGYKCIHVSRGIYERLGHVHFA